ncbi:MAG TPA: quinone oxidoreductase [Vicinamibacteria bacterium]|nr:quinone oxidoreductase [Vicinamibacteria bacterium]
MKAIRIHAPGGPEALRYESVPDPTPGPEEAVIRLQAAGVNFIDVYHRTGLYPMEPPFTPGMEGAGVVERVGENVTEVKVGDLVAWAMAVGSYAELARVPAWKLVPVPGGVDGPTAAAAMLQGMTAHYLSGATFPLGPEHDALVHAAAGGVGLLLVQMAKKRGARVFGTVSTPEKAEAARKAGADVVIRYTEEDFEEAVKSFTRGKGLHVVYDSVGKTTFEKSLRCLRPRGMLVLYGQSSGAVPPLDAQILARGGSLFLTRPTLAHYTLDRDEVLARAGDVLSWIVRAELDITIDRELPLEEAAEAHRLIESRKTSGKLLLRP